MARSAAQIITASFYAWETRGRGWDVADYPVALEPVFRPFFLLPQQLVPVGPIDDGKRPTILSSLVDGAKRLFAPSEHSPEPPVPYVEQPPFPALPRPELTALSVCTPPEFALRHDVATQLLVALSAALEPLSFEMIGADGAVTLQIVAAPMDAIHIKDTVQGYAPAVSVLESEDRLDARWVGTAKRAVVEFGLSHEFFLPLSTSWRGGADPFVPLIPALARAGPGEFVALQVLFERVRNPWARAIVSAIDDGEGGCLIADAPEFVDAAKEKTGRPLFAAVLRVAAQAASVERAEALARGTRAFVLQFARSGGNALASLSNDDNDDRRIEVDLLTRHSHRTGMLLSAEELSGFVHLPDASVVHPALERLTRHTKALPPEGAGHAFTLGENIHAGIAARATLSDEARLQHTWVIGVSGTGKSTLLLNCILQDIDAGRGIAVLDPHGDLIDEVLARIPEGRRDNVVVFDPSDAAWPIGFNILAAESEVERNLLASDLVGIFERFATSWGDTMTTVLGNAVLALLEHPEGGTLLDLRRFVIDERFRSAWVAQVPDEEIRFFWSTQYPLIGTRSIGPIMSRLDTFLRSRLIRHIVGQRRPKLDLAEVMRSGKTFLARLPQGLIGEENAFLLGSLLVSKFHQLALSRQALPVSERRPFFLYADEFQHFVTPSMEALLAEARKYRLGLTLAHQTLAQIASAPKVESALFGNAYTRIVFRVGDADARRLAEGLASFETKDIQTLARGEAIVRVGGAAHDFNLRTFPPLQVDADTAEMRRDAVIVHSRERYAVPAVELAAALSARYAKVEEPVAEAPQVPPALEPGAIPEPPEPAVIAEPLTATSPPTRAARPRGTRQPFEPAPLGRGGQEHRYLQHLVQRLAEERGFRATIEEDAGAGKADVMLRRGTLTVACEISITTDVAHELGNLKKCLEGGCSRILFIAPERKQREKVAQRLKDLGANIPIDIVGPDELVVALDALEPAPTTETTVRGYKVKVKRQHLSPDDLAGRRAAIAEVIVKSLGKHK